MNDIFKFDLFKTYIVIRYYGQAICSDTRFDIR